MVELVLLQFLSITAELEGNRSDVMLSLDILAGIDVRSLWNLAARDSELK